MTDTTNKWDPVPFSFWLYSQVCARNETTWSVALEQMTALALMVDTIPAPKTWFQRILYKHITGLIGKKMKELAALIEKGLMASGFIVFTPAQEDTNGIAEA